MTKEEEEAVKKDAEGAADQQKSESELLEEQIAAKDAEIVRLSTERDNYKKGMLKAKGKITTDDKEDDEDDEEEDLDTKIDRKIEERAIDTKLNQALSEKEALLKQGLARIKELETAIKNRSQISTAGAGSSTDTKMTAKDPILSQEKINYFKSLGWDDKKIERYKQNLMKTK